MDILFVTTDHGTPVAEATSALAKAVKGLGHRVMVASPLYRGIDPRARSLARRLTEAKTQADGETFSCAVYEGRTVAGVELLYLGHDGLFAGVSDVFEEGDATLAARRVGVFARALACALENRHERFDVVHAHGYGGALALRAIRERGEGQATLLTVHDPADRGGFDPALASVLGLGEGDVHAGAVDVLGASLPFADRVVVTSATTARALVESDEAFAPLGERLSGVPYGVDAATWNPVTDPALPARFDPVDRRGKARCKRALTREVGLPVRDDVPLLVVAGPGRTESGVTRFTAIASKVLRNDVQVVVQVTDGDDSETAATLEDLSERWPDRIQVVVDETEERTHQLFGAGDVLVVTGEAVDATLAALRAHRYGLIPVVSSAEPTRDVVVDCDPGLQTGNGVVYDGHSSEELLAGVRRAIAAFARPAELESLRQRMMRLDHSWDRSARLYEALYRELQGTELAA